MVKGCRRNMILLKNVDSDSIEEAYFVLREGMGEEGDGQARMIEEAKRILSGNVIARQETRRKKSRGAALGWLCFMVGALLGGGMTALTFLLV